MALQLEFLKENIENGFQFDFKKAYFKISICDIDTATESIKVCLSGFADSYARHNNGLAIYSKIFLLKFSDLEVKSFSKNDIFTAVYNLFKASDEFKNSSDV